MYLDYGPCFPYIFEEIPIISHRPAQGKAINRPDGHAINARNKKK